MGLSPQLEHCCGQYQHRGGGKRSFLALFTYLCPWSLDVAAIDPQGCPGPCQAFSIQLECGGVLCQEEHHHFQAAGMDITRSLSATRGHPNSKPYMGKLPERWERISASGVTQDFGILRSQIFISVFL